MRENTKLLQMSLRQDSFPKDALIQRQVGGDDPEPQPLLSSSQYMQNENSQIEINRSRYFQMAQSPDEMKPISQKTQHLKSSEQSNYVSSEGVLNTNENFSCPPARDNLEGVDQSLRQTKHHDVPKRGKFSSTTTAFDYSSQGAEKNFQASLIIHKIDQGLVVLHKPPSKKIVFSEKNQRRQSRDQKTTDSFSKDLSLDQRRENSLAELQIKQIHNRNSSVSREVPHFQRIFTDQAQSPLTPATASGELRNPTDFAALNIPKPSSSPHKARSRLTNDLKQLLEENLELESKDKANPVSDAPDEFSPARQEDNEDPKLGGIEEETSQNSDDNFLHEDEEECFDQEGDDIAQMDNYHLDEEDIISERGQSSEDSDPNSEGEPEPLSIEKKSSSKQQNKDKTKPSQSKKESKQNGGASKKNKNLSTPVQNPSIKITIQNKKSQKVTVNSKPGNTLQTPVQSKGKADKLQNSSGSAQKQQSQQNSVQKKKKQNKLVALLHSMPKNLEEEHTKFFEGDCLVNPVFEYENLSLAQKFLQQFKTPSDDFMQIAKKILESFLKVYGCESNYLATEGNILTQEETEKHFMDYLEDLEVADEVVLNFAKNKVAPTSVTHDPKGGKSKINIGLPIEYREGRMLGVLHHEIGTHFLRKFNEKHQVWYKKRDKYELKSCIQTEEGFASINQLFEMCHGEAKNPFLYKAALNYYSAYMASQMSFVELFNDLEKYIDNPTRRWKCTVRVKRGIADTKEPGGLYKDQVYLEGAVHILRDRKNIDFVGLYCGKLSLDDLKKPVIQTRLKKEDILLPTFMKNMDDYMKALDYIAKTNFIE